jgi:DNA-binding transcriptional ArsR family regulator
MSEMPGFDKELDSIVLKTLLSEGELTASHLVMKAKLQSDKITSDSISHRLVWLTENGLVVEHHIDPKRNAIRHGSPVEYTINEEKKEAILQLIE